MKNTPVTGWTDYPITELGDIAGEKAPLRRVEVLSWNRDKYCCILVFEGDRVVHTNFKRWYVYTRKGRLHDVPQINDSNLARLPRSCCKNDNGCPFYNTETA